MLLLSKLAKLFVSLVRLHKNALFSFKIPSNLGFYSLACDYKERYYFIYLYNINPMSSKQSHFLQLMMQKFPKYSSTSVCVGNARGCAMHEAYPYHT